MTNWLLNFATWSHQFFITIKTILTWYIKVFPFVMLIDISNIECFWNLNNISQSEAIGNSFHSHSKPIKGKHLSIQTENLFTTNKFKYKFPPAKDWSLSSSPYYLKGTTYLINNKDYLNWGTGTIYFVGEDHLSHRSIWM